MDQDFTEVEPDVLQLAIQALDGEYFAEHPDDDYYVRGAYPDELGMAGHPDYDGLILVYRDQERGVRMRKTVTSIDEGIAFMVQYEGSRGV